MLPCKRPQHTFDMQNDTLDRIPQTRDDSAFHRGWRTWMRRRRDALQYEMETGLRWKILGKYLVLVSHTIFRRGMLSPRARVNHFRYEQSLNS